MKYSILVIFFVLCFVACSYDRDISDEMSLAIAEEILKYTPEHTHFSESTRFIWMALDSENINCPEPIFNLFVELAQEKYKIYHNLSDIPDDQKHISDRGKLLSYKDGFSFGFKVEFLKWKKIKIESWDWVGNLAASSRWKIYKWNGKKLEIIKRGPETIS